MFASEEPSRMSKVLTACAVGMGVGFGTCGLVVFTKAVEGRVWSVIAMGGAILFFVSLAVLLVALLVALVSLIKESFRQ